MGDPFPFYYSFPIQGRIAIGGVAVVMLGVGTSLTLYARRLLARNGLARD
jgi:hypothetical protein